MTYQTKIFRMKYGPTHSNPDLKEFTVVWATPSDTATERCTVRAANPAHAAVIAAYMDYDPYMCGPEGVAGCPSFQDGVCLVEGHPYVVVSVQAILKSLMPDHEMGAHLAAMLGNDQMHVAFFLPDLPDAYRKVLTDFYHDPEKGVYAEEDALLYDAQGAELEAIKADIKDPYKFWIDKYNKDLEG